MLGKASEIKIEELYVQKVNWWLNNHPDVEIIEIKYAVKPNTGDELWVSSALIIYKEANTHE